MKIKVGNKIQYTEQVVNKYDCLGNRQQEKSYFLSGGTVQGIYPHGILVKGTYKSGIEAREFINSCDLACGMIRIGGII